MDSRPLSLPPGGSDGGLVKEPTAGGRGTDGNTGRVPGPTRMSTAMCNRDRGLADSAAVHSK